MGGTYSDLQVWQAAMDLAEDIYTDHEDLSEGRNLRANCTITASGGFRPE